MIENRPALLLDRSDYLRPPKVPVRIEYASVPELIKFSLIQLSGVQPIIEAAAAAAGEALLDALSPGEIDLYRERGTQFQLISVVASLAHITIHDGIASAVPYAISLIPAQKRGAVDARGIDLIEKLDTARLLKEYQPSYIGYDPFAGDWQLYGPAGLFLRDQAPKCFLDEVGLVIEQYFLATEHDPDDLLRVNLGFSSARAEEKFHRHRELLVFRPF